MILWPVGRTAILDDDCPEVVTDGIQGSGQNADRSGNAGDQDRVHFKGAKRQIEICFEERTEPSLWHQIVLWKPVQLIPNIGSGSSSQAVGGHLPFEDKILRHEAVTGKEHGQTSPVKGIDQSIEPIDESPGRLYYGRFRVVLKSISQEIHNNQCWVHFTVLQFVLVYPMGIGIQIGRLPESLIQ